MKIKEKLTPVMGIDWIDSHTGLRNSCFQLCHYNDAGKFEAIAVVDFHGGIISRAVAADRIKDKLPAIKRYARMFRERSIPVTFHPIPA
jgi:hypothetical protein